MQSVASESSICEIFCSASWGGTYDNPWQCEALVQQFNGEILLIGPLMLGQTLGYCTSAIAWEEKVTGLNHFSESFCLWLHSVCLLDPAGHPRLSVLFVIE